MDKNENAARLEEAVPIWSRTNFAGFVRSSGIRISKNKYWLEYLSMVNKLSNDDFLPVMERLYNETGAKFHCIEGMFEALKPRFSDSKIVEFFTGKFDTAKLEKMKLLRTMVDENDRSLV